MNWANVLTCTRILLCVPMSLVEPFSLAFYVFYLGAGATDMADGYIARHTGMATKLGALLDSVADAAFFAVLIYITASSLTIPAGTLIWVLAIVIIRLLSYGIGYRKYHTFTALHTYANKATGLLLFGFPVLYAACGVIPAASIICVAATLSALEELLINMTSMELDRNARSIWGRKLSI